ncbi:alkene reductase [Pontibacter korlensis]|uniref:NADH:flavin oxidoreductase n=1 Tax=Pontibacter korlensis TaxID=400092 RepID=A0A0E3ZFN7_9BACT|nr:alkene reductase [Pontibacter korlensis]AKD02989.1 NADH:flavin oxidoreductase [Pontibacter korlensis]
MSQPLLKPIKLNNLELQNRIAMAPMTRTRANNPEKAPTDLIAEYYEQRAGAGLIISEGTPVSTQGVGYINIPGIYSEAQVEGWKKVTKAVHDKGGKIFAQLWHVGRVSHPDFHNGKAPVAPSAINPNDQVFTEEGFKPTVTPRALKIAEIKQIVQDFKNAAKNAVEAGFDGVEIHSSNGYLFHQFFVNCSNTRTDEYGGSRENRSRLLFEVLDAVKEVMPIERVGVRLNPSMHNLFGITVDEETIPTFDYIIDRLNDSALAYLHLSEPFTDVTNVPHAEPNIAKRYRPRYNGTLIINKGFNQETGNKVIADGDADMVAFGVPFIANPDLPKRFEQNVPLSEADRETFYATGAEGYTDYPVLEEIEA